VLAKGLPSFAPFALPPFALPPVPPPFPGRSIRSLDVLTVHYSPGALLLSEAASGDARAAKLLLAARNLALPSAAAINTGLTSGVPGLRELVTELDQHIPGGGWSDVLLSGEGYRGRPSVHAAAGRTSLLWAPWQRAPCGPGPSHRLASHLPRPAPPARRDRGDRLGAAGVAARPRRRRRAHDGRARQSDLHAAAGANFAPCRRRQALCLCACARSQLSRHRARPLTALINPFRAFRLHPTPQRFVLISTAGVLELEKRRPVDVLAALLSERDAPKLGQFFSAFGPAEAAAMCYLLVTSDPADVPAVGVVHLHRGPVAAAAAAGAPGRAH
jgi:hypothetical protein